MSRTSSHPVLPRLAVRRPTKQLVRQQASLDSVLSPDSTPDCVTVKTRDTDGETVSWKVYVTEVNGVRTLDLYCPEEQDSHTKKTPLTELSEEVCELTHLQRLWASHHLLSSLPPALPRLTHLRDLLLHNNKFSTFPTAVCHLPSLQMLWLSSNQIPSIPSDISNLTSLRRLHLDHNLIAELPDPLCSLTQLEVLYMNHNSLQRVSESVGNLTSLRHLLLHHNLISQLPHSLVELAALERLDVRYNRLKHLSKEFRVFQAEKNDDGKRVLTEENPFDKPLTRMRSADQTSPVLRPRTMSFPLSGHMRRKSDSLNSPSPSSPSYKTPQRRHLFVHSFSEDQA